jgi:hypothetical protein
MVNDRPFTHPDFGNEVRLEQYGLEVHLVFVAKTQKQSDSAISSLLEQLKSGVLNITLMGNPTNIKDE